MPNLFDPLTIGPVTLENRIMLSSMCQYSSNDGVANDWHLAHLLQLAMGGMGLVMTEATHVKRAGANIALLPGTVFGRVPSWPCTRRQRDPSASRLPDRHQLAHAGRKGSNHRPWEGGGPLSPDRAWPIVGPSAIPHDEGWHPPAMHAAVRTRVICIFPARSSGEVLPRYQSASGWGLIWNCTISLVAPLPPSRWYGEPVLKLAHTPRPFHPEFGSSMRPSRPLL